MGTTLGPDILAQCKALFDDEQSLYGSKLPVACDMAYGPDIRQRLDIYAPENIAQPLPIIVFVHGGGFRVGDKGGPDNWPNATVGRWAAREGFLGIVINYRLLPDHIWPSGAEDVALVVAWIKENADRHGGDPSRIVLMGTSAGSVHIAGYLKLHPDADADISGAVLLSGLYGYTPLDPKDEGYYGPQSDYADKMPLDAVASTQIPLFVAAAQFDPPRFQAEYLGLLQDRLARHGHMPRSYIASGHNHYSMAMHIGTSDTRLADEIIQFSHEVTYD